MKGFARLLLLCLLLIPLTVYAQAATEAPQATRVVTLGINYFISVPADWKLSLNEDGSYTLSGSGLAVSVTTPTRLHSMSVNFTSGTSIVDVESALVTLFDGVQIENSDIQKAAFGARTGAVYTYTDNDASDQLEIALPLSDGSFGYLSFSAPKGQLDSLRSQINEIAASFDTTLTAATEEAGSTGTAGTAGTGATCTVSVEKANTAQLRVGPGKNRGAIAFLPANTDVTVTGRIQLSDGSVWYQLDKSEAAPKGTTASQLWVSADAVVANGDCDQVGDTAAPPVIPGVVAPPANTSSGGGSSGGSSSANAAPGALPASGAWVLTMADTTNASCQGYQNVPVPSNQVFPTMTFGGTILIVNQGSFTLDGNPFNRMGSSNSFLGSYTFDDGTNDQMTFNLITSTTMNGQLVGNGTYNGIPCSATALFSAHHG